ncbi:MAG: serine/threonine-protein kinase [Myxococcota bacterium]
MSIGYEQMLRRAKARVGARVGPYRLRALIDVGGMAAVYRGRQKGGDPVAIKVMHDAYLSLREARERFRREIYIANRVEHPDVVEVLDDGQSDEGNPYYVMALLQGCSLHRQLRVERLDVAYALWVGDRILDVLRVAHEIGVYHRDIKPGNIFLTEDGEVKVLDFGLAFLHDWVPRSRGAQPGRKKRLTRTGTVIGTASYMSPEQALCKPWLVDRRTDLWSVGAVLFRSLTGETVHNEVGTGALLAAATRPARSLASAGSFPAGLVALVDRALAYRLEDRWPDALAMQDALRRLHVDLEAGVPSVCAIAASSDDERETTPMSVSFLQNEDSESVIIEVGDVEEEYELLSSEDEGVDVVSVSRRDNPDLTSDTGDSTSD